MYRRATKRQQEAQTRKVEAMLRGKVRARQSRPAPSYPPDLPDLRREVIVIDYDSGQPVTHTLRLYRTERVDTYRIEADGKPWRRGGWSVCMAGLRKAYQRVPSPRSDYWMDA